MGFKEELRLVEVNQGLDLMRKLLARGFGCCQVLPAVIMFLLCVMLYIVFALHCAEKRVRGIVRQIKLTEPPPLPPTDRGGLRAGMI